MKRFKMASTSGVLKPRMKGRSRSIPSSMDVLGFVDKIL
jgi:hypothetical protein